MTKITTQLVYSARVVVELSSVVYKFSIVANRAAWEGPVNTKEVKNVTWVIDADQTHCFGGIKVQQI